jgi:hypothetical protein
VPHTFNVSAYKIAHVESDGVGQGKNDEAKASPAAPKAITRHMPTVLLVSTLGPIPKIIVVS